MTLSTYLENVAILDLVLHGVIFSHNSTHNGIPERYHSWSYSTTGLNVILKISGQPSVVANSFAQDKIWHFIIHLMEMRKHS